MPTIPELEARIAALETRHQQTQAAMAIVTAMARATDEDELLRTLVQGLAQSADVPDLLSAGLMYVDLDEWGNPSGLELAANWRRGGPLHVPVGTRFDLSEFPFSQLWVGSPDEPQIVSDVAADPRLDDTIQKRVLALGIRALVVIPLLLAGRWVGILSFHWDAPRVFGEEEIALYNALPAPVSSVVETHHLLRTLEQVIQQQIGEVALFKAMAEHSPIAIIMTDQEGNVAYANPVSCSLLGDTLLGQPLAAVADDPADLTQKFRRALETGALSDIVAYRRADGSLFTGQTTVFAVPDVVRQSQTVSVLIRDITEQRRAEQAVQQTRQQLQDIFDNTPMVFYVKDLQGHYTFVNLAWRERTGYGDREMLGQTNRELFPQYYGEEVWDQHEKEVLASGRTTTFEEIGRTTGCAYLSAKFLLRDADGQPYALCSSSIDISKRKRAEEAARQARQQLQDIFDNIPAVVYAKDMEGRYILMNREYRRRTGLGDRDVIGKTQQELFPHLVDSIGKTWDPHERQVLESGKAVTFEEVGQTTGSAYLSTKFLLRDADGTPYALCSGSFDVSALKQVEEERGKLLVQVQEQAQQVQQIVSTVPEGVLLLDAAHTIVLANPAAEQCLAFLAGSQVGDTLTRLGDRSLDELLTSPPEGLWHEVVSHDTPPRSFEVIAQPIEARPANNGGWVLVIRDVTREREIQWRVQQQERLAAVGQLAAGIAHDFNNIIAVIVLYAQIVLQTVELPLKAQERLQTIAQQARRATDLIEQVLDFSRRSMMERQPLELVPFLKEQVKLLGRTLPENIRLDLAFDPADYTVNADPTRIQQVVMNLVLNARDAMPDGGDLRIGLARLQVGPGSRPVPEMEAGDWVRLTVADTGMGIPPEVRSHIFEPFFTTKPPGSGTGLGLSQVYGIVKQHEGHIDVTSLVGEGATFIVYLPALTRPAGPPEPEAQALVRGDGETILVVEDDAATRDVLVASLDLLNYRSLTADDGTQALDVWEQHRDVIALVLSDVVMPHMGGIALFHALRERAAVHFVLLTGHLLEHQMEHQLGELKALGLADWLQKPPSLKDLSRVIGQVLGKT